MFLYIVKIDCIAVEWFPLRVVLLIILVLVLGSLWCYKGQYHQDAVSDLIIIIFLFYLVQSIKEKNLKEKIQRAYWISLFGALQLFNTCLWKEVCIVLLTRWCNYYCADILNVELDASWSFTANGDFVWDCYMLHLIIVIVVTLRRRFFVHFLFSCCRMTKILFMLLWAMMVWNVW